MQRFNSLLDYVSHTATFKNYSFGGEGLRGDKKIMAPLTAFLKFMPEDGKFLPSRLKEETDAQLIDFHIETEMT